MSPPGYFHFFKSRGDFKLWQLRKYWPKQKNTYTHLRKRDNETNKTQPIG